MQGSRVALVTSTGVRRNLQIIESRDGSGNMVRQLIHGTRYIDELVIMRAKDKGDLYVHQAERDQGGSVKDWNVIALTDMAGRVVERYVYTPYGEIKVHQGERDRGGSVNAHGDYDGDGDVDGNEWPEPTQPPSFCTTMTGACRILDLDFDGDFDGTDRTLHAALPQGWMRHPARPATAVHQPFGHQGLLFEPEIGSYQNRARQYLDGARRFAQRDPVGIGAPVLARLDGSRIQQHRAWSGSVF